MSTILEMHIEELEDELVAIKAINQKLQLEKNALKEQLTLTDVSHQRELLAKYTRWQGGFYEKESDMFADIDKFLNG